MNKKKTETQVIDGVIDEFTLNKYGVKIKKCCASCKYHEPHDHDGPHRYCKPKDKIVLKNDCCGDWIISEAIDKIKLRA
jgi:hypothetical protein